MGRSGRRCKQILDDVKEMRSYWKLKVEAIDHTLWRTCLERSYRTYCKTDHVMMMNVV
jgi:hypothetical protein